MLRYKTAFYSFYCSVALGMIVFGVEDQKAYDSAREILMVMGIYFQAQDDYLDCYATKEVLGKIGTDIQDKKCGWLFCKAYCELPITSEQRQLLKVRGAGRGEDFACAFVRARLCALAVCTTYAYRTYIMLFAFLWPFALAAQDNYGSWDDEKVQRVKALYRELGLEALYHQYEEASYAQIMALKPTVDGLLPWSIFEIFLSKVYKRSK